MTKDRYADAVGESLDKINDLENEVDPFDPANAEVVVSSIRTFANEIEEAAKVYNLENKKS